jgi:hypothetical protein
MVRREKSLPHHLLCGNSWSFSPKSGRNEGVFLELFFVSAMIEARNCHHLLICRHRPADESKRHA